VATQPHVKIWVHLGLILWLNQAVFTELLLLLFFELSCPGVFRQQANLDDLDLLSDDLSLEHHPVKALSFASFNRLLEQ
jgi:hypothetical protein